ncbi:MAG TPA: hypothetical protein VHH73_10110, partial [Verrucomicrobiae bacterium]|nr:hypothetical protein [Verrucomicrobiae bacterium]
PTAVLFGDGDQDERHEMWVNSIQIRSGKISDAEAEALGGPAASGIPILITGVVVVPPAEPAKLTIAAAGNGVVVSWPLAATGFTLESSPSLTSPTWTAVTGVANNSVTITATGTQFYRLRK